MHIIRIIQVNTSSFIEVALYQDDTDEHQLQDIDEPHRHHSCLHLQLATSRKNRPLNQELVFFCVGLGSAGSCDPGAGGIALCVQIYYVHTVQYTTNKWTALSCVASAKKTGSKVS